MTGIEQAIDKAGDWLDIEGVEAVSQGEQDGAPVLLVHLSLPQAARSIPSKWMGFPVVTQMTEPFQAQPGPELDDD